MKFSLASDGSALGVDSPPEVRASPVFDALTAGRASIYAAPGSPGAAISPRSALSLAAYYAAINVLSTDLACLPLKLYRRRKSGGRDEVVDDPRSEMLGLSPDNETTSMRWRQAWIGHMLGNGNGYTELDFISGEIGGLYLLDPCTEPDRRTQDNRLYYRLPDGSTRPPYKVLHLAGLGFDGLKGYSVATTARQAIRLGIAAETFGASFFDNGTQASGFFKTPTKMNADAQDNFRHSVNSRHQGASNAFKFMVLEQGMDWVQSTISPDDAQFLATRQFQVVEIARLFRLPPHKLGDYSQSHLANIEFSNIDYMTTTLMPWCESIEQELNRKLFTAEERRSGFYVEHQMQAFLRGDMKARAEFYERMMGLGVFTANDIAGRENMNPIGPDGDERFMSVQMQPLRVALNPPEPAPAPAPADPGTPPGDPPAPPSRARFAMNGSNGHGH